MTGIIITGRTGAAFAAQIGSMKVNEELDALKAMGILGGFFISQAMMDISAYQFFIGLQDTVSPSDFFLGLFKGVIFGILIALSGCFRGLQCGNRT